MTQTTIQSLKGKAALHRELVKWVTHDAIWRIDFTPPISLRASRSQQVQEVFDRGIYTNANDVVAKVYGYKRADEIIGRPLNEFLLPSNPDNIEQIKKLVRSKYKIKNALSYERDNKGRRLIILNNVTAGIHNSKLFYIFGASANLTEFIKIQEELKESKKVLLKQKSELKNKNITLREIVAQIALEKDTLKRQVMANIEKVILPSFDKLRLKNGTKKHLDNHRRSLEGLISSFGIKISDIKLNLTPREIEICNMVKNGNTNKEIAALLNIALHTVEKHRRMARNKLGLTNKDINLTTYLNSL